MSSTLRRAVSAMRLGRKDRGSSDVRPKKIRIHIPPDRPAACRTGYLSIATIVRNEAPYLAEWLEFHRMLGVEHIYFYDNESTDDSIGVISPFAQDNFVTVTPWPFPWNKTGEPAGQ